MDRVSETIVEGGGGGGGETMVQEPGTTEVEAFDERIDDPTAMTYNATDGTFTNVEGDPLDQTGVLKLDCRSSDHIGPSGYACALRSRTWSREIRNEKSCRLFKKLEGSDSCISGSFRHVTNGNKDMDVGEIALNPLNSLWALGIRNAEKI